MLGHPLRMTLGCARRSLTDGSTARTSWLAKTHPCLVDFNALPPEQQVKDYLFKAVVQSLVTEYEMGNWSGFTTNEICPAEMILAQHIRYLRADTKLLAIFGKRIRLVPFGKVLDVGAIPVPYATLPRL